MGWLRISRILGHKATSTSRLVFSGMSQFFQPHRTASHWRFTDRWERAHTFVRASHIRTLSWELHTLSTSFASQLIHPTAIRSSCLVTRPNCHVAVTSFKLTASGRISSRMILSASPQPPFCILCHAWGMSSRKPLFRERWIHETTSQASNGPRPRCQ